MLQLLVLSFIIKLYACSNIFKYVFKTSSRHVFKTSSRHVFKTSSRHVFNKSSRHLQGNNFSSSKTSWRRLQCNIFCPIKCLENVLKTSCELILKTSWRRLKDVSGRRIANTSWRRLEGVLEDKKLLRWRRLQSMSWRTNVCWADIS